MGKKADRRVAALEAELAHAVETVRFVSGLMVQVWAILMAANALVVGYSIAERTGVGFQIGALTMVAACLATLQVGRVYFPLFVSALRAERELRTDDGLVSTVGKTMFLRFYTDIEAAAGAQIVAGQQGPGGAAANRRIVHIFVAGALAESALGVALCLWGGFTWF